jgi:hypothetical protein
MHYSTMPGVPGVYIEGSYSGHKASPGKYTITLRTGQEQVMATIATILANPLYQVDANTYNEYHTLMNTMETELTRMHQLINTLYAKKEQLQQLLETLPPESKYDNLRKEGQALVQRMKAWDEEMVQRKSKVYDDVDNFPNKFTANYLFLINQTESDIPSVNKPSIDRLKELNAQWSSLKTQGTDMLEKNIPAYNKLLWEAGVGAVWKK